jgi:cytochrome c553
MASNGEALSQKCVACHDTNFDKSALGKSAIVQGQSADQIYASLRAYKAGTQNKAGLGAMMKGQVSSYSDYDLHAVSEYIASLWPLACTPTEMKAMPFDFGSNYMLLASHSDAYPLIYVDSRDIEIDRKNKIITVWTLWLSSRAEQADKIRQDASAYSSYGSMYNLFTIDYRNMRFSNKSAGLYDCNSKIILSLKDAINKGKIEPHSPIEDITKSIMKEYNLN